MIRVAFCDDEKDVIDKYEAYIEECAKQHSIDVAFYRFNSGETLLFYLSDTPWKIDIIYLDILMGKMDGMETARKLRKANSNAQIVFLTGTEDYVYDAFDVGAVHYLLKEKVTFAHFEKLFLHMVERVCRQNEEQFVCEFDGAKKIVPMEKIYYFEIWKRVITVFYGDGESAKFYGSMDQLKKQLADKNFVRVHRSYMVHLTYVTQIHPRTITLKSGVNIPLGKTYSDGFKVAFSKYISDLKFYGISSSEEQEVKE